MAKWAGPSRVTGWFLLRDFSVGEVQENRGETKWGGSKGPPLLFSKGKGGWSKNNDRDIITKKLYYV